MSLKCIFRISKLGAGGAERVFISIADYLKDIKGSEIIFVVDNNEGKTIDVVKSKGMRVIPLNVKRSIFSLSKFKVIIDSFQPDIIISAYPDTNGAALLSNLFSKHKCAIVVTEHSSIKRHWANASIFRRFQVRLIVSLLYRLANKIICVSDGVRDEVVNLVGRPHMVETIYNPVRFGISKNRSSVPKDRRKIVLAVGRISKPKDYSTLIEAFSLLKSTDSLLKIVGTAHDIDEYERLKVLVTQKNLESRIEFVGYTPSPEDFYETASLFVLSSAWEGFGNVVVEALSFGLPIVSTNCESGPAEILQDGKFGRLVPVGDFKAMAQAIDDLLMNNPYDKHSQKNRSLFFSEEKIGEQYFSMIERCVKNNRMEL